MDLLGGEHARVGFRGHLDEFFIVSLHLRHVLVRYLVRIHAPSA